MIVDPEYQHLLESSWINNKGYAVFYDKETKKGKSLHRYIYEIHHKVKLKIKELVDHANHDKLDNRIANLRLSNHSTNGMNQIRKNGKKGIRKLPSGSYQARITVNGKLITLGSFLTERDAIFAYNLASKKYHGKYGKLINM